MSLTLSQQKNVDSLINPNRYTKIVPNALLKGQSNHTDKDTANIFVNFFSSITYIFSFLHINICQVKKVIFTVFLKNLSKTSYDSLWSLFDPKGSTSRHMAHMDKLSDSAWGVFKLNIYLSLCLKHIRKNQFFVF